MTMAPPTTRRAGSNVALHTEIADRFGILPNFFKLAPETPAIAQNFWGFAKFAYLDSPLPSLFKERLFVHLSRYCEVRYCLGRHFSFLVGRGRSSGDDGVPVMKTRDAIGLLKRSFASNVGAESHVRFLRGVVGPLNGAIVPDSQLETALFAICTAVFRDPAKGAAHLALLRRLFGIEAYEYLLLFIGFIRMAHYWTQVHPELEDEEDLTELMAQLEAIAWGLAWESSTGWATALKQVTGELDEMQARARQS
jgi:hypothetical protein